MTGLLRQQAAVVLETGHLKFWYFSLIIPSPQPNCIHRIWLTLEIASFVFIERSALQLQAEHGCRRKRFNVQRLGVAQVSLGVYMQVDGLSYLRTKMSSQPRVSRVFMTAINSVFGHVFHA